MTDIVLRRDPDGSVWKKLSLEEVKSLLNPQPEPPRVQQKAVTGRTYNPEYIKARATEQKRTMSPETKAKLAAAMRKRWAKGEFKGRGKR